MALRFETLRRALGVLLAVIVIAAVSGTHVHAPVAPSVVYADDEGEDDDEGEGDDDEGGNDDDQDDDDGDDEDEDEPTRGQTATEAELPVNESDPVGVEVSCTWDGTSNRSTCEFIPFGGTAPIADIFIPATVVCADVTGGDFETDEPKAAETDAETVEFYSARSGATDVVLIFTDEVTTSGATTYWVDTDSGREPASGSGLACPNTATPAPSSSPENASDDQTGSITVQAFTCEMTVPADPEAFDWYGECADPASALTFDLFLGDGDKAVKSIQADKDGRATFLNLNPGAYRLEQAGSSWCHAESDSVTAAGEVLAVEGQESLVWVFQCATEPSGS